MFVKEIKEFEGNLKANTMTKMIRQLTFYPRIKYAIKNNKKIVKYLKQRQNRDCNNNNNKQGHQQQPMTTKKQEKEKKFNIINLSDSKNQ